jgi:uncharacterized membrane protein
MEMNKMIFHNLEALIMFDTSDYIADLSYTNFNSHNMGLYHFIFDDFKPIIDVF